MKTKTLVFLLITLILTLNACNPFMIATSSSEQPTPVSGEVKPTQETPGVPADTLITLERTACFGFCPIYTLKIHADGKVEYEGIDFVEVKGSQSSSITPDQVKELVDAFDNADYFNLPDEYTALVTDIPTTITSITLNGKTKRITNYGGCMDLDSSARAPQALCDLELRIDEVTNSAQWIGTPTTTSDPFGTVPACTELVDVPVVNGTVTFNNISFKLDPALATSVKAYTCPAVPQIDNVGPGDAHPPYTAFFPNFERTNTDYKPEIRVYEITGDMQSYAYPLNMLAELKNVLSQQAKPVIWFAAPLHTHEAYLNFASGSGVRGLVQFMQDVFFFTNNGLNYEFNGLTQDGRYFVSVRYPVKVPFLMELDGLNLPPNNLNPESIAIPQWPEDYDEQRKIIETYNTEALRQFEQMSDDQVQPNLALLDSLVQSIQIRNP